MGKTAILLLGVLSMFFAEVLSGASTLWFLNPWGLLVTMPLYLGHAAFLFNIAVRWRRTSLRHLYFLGMIFGLYEALITKVLWHGYPDSTGPMLGTLLGVAWGEFITLVLFWHPVMSFIIPLLAYEALSGDIAEGHEGLLRRSRRNLAGVLALIVVGALFQSNGAKFDASVSLGSMIGTVLIIGLLNRLSRGKSLQSLILGKRGMAALSLYLVALYGATTALLLPDRLPATWLPYLAILLWYLVSIGLLAIDKPTVLKASTEPARFKAWDLPILAAALICATAFFSLVPTASYPILLVFFISLIGAGAVLFLGCVLSLSRTLRSGPAHA
jgi:hypothetical protein